MPKRTDIQSILIIGAGPIGIGQACASDYSGTQALADPRINQTHPGPFEIARVPRGDGAVA